MAKSYQIPFDENGNLLSYPGWCDCEWKDNYEFDATLRYESFARGRSAANIVWRDCSNDKQYTMFLTDFNDLMKSGWMIGPKLSLRWTFQKRGSNYGIRLADSYLKK